jgi:hypothetical protein
LVVLKGVVSVGETSSPSFVPSSAREKESNAVATHIRSIMPNDMMSVLAFLFFIISTLS